MITGKFNIVILLLAVFALGLNNSEAQRILPGTDHPIWEDDGGVVVSRRPETTNMMNFTKGYMEGVRNRARPGNRNYDNAVQKIQNWKNEIDNDPFYTYGQAHRLGTEWNVAVHVAQDVIGGIDDLFGSCGDIAYPPVTDGAWCWRRRCRDMFFWTMCWWELPGERFKSYRLPIQMVEMVENRGQSGYMVDPVSRPHTIAGNAMYNFLASGLDEGFEDIPIIGGLVDDILEPVTDLFGDVVGSDVKFTTRIMDTTAKVAGLRDHLYLYGCEHLDITDTAGIVDCLGSQFFNDYKEISDFEWHDSDGNLIADNMIKRLNDIEVTTTNRFGAEFTSQPYNDIERRYQGYHDIDNGWRTLEYHLYQPSPFNDILITTLREFYIVLPAPIGPVYPFRDMLGQCERRKDHLVYFSEWPYALGEWNFGFGGLPGIIEHQERVRRERWFGWDWVRYPAPAGVIYSRSAGASYMDYVIANRGQGKEGARMRTAHRQKYFNYLEFDNPGTLATRLGNGSHNTSADPFACSRGNMIWSKGRTPSDMLYPLTRGQRPGTGGPQAPGPLAGTDPGRQSRRDIEPGICQGVNLGSWGPGLTRTQLQHGPHASEANFIKAIAAVRANPSPQISGRAYRIDPYRDKIQWIRDEDLSDPDDCQDIGIKAGWNYTPDQNSKDVEMDDHDDEFWNVAIHWKRFQCCNGQKRCRWSAWTLPPIPEWPWGGGCTDRRDEYFDIRE